MFENQFSVSRKDTKNESLLKPLVEQQEELEFCKKPNCDTQKILNEQLKVVQEITHTGFWAFDFQTKEFFWTDELFRICGFKAQEFIPKPNDFFNLVHEEDKENVLKYFKEPDDEKKLEFRLVTSNHNIVWAQTKISFEVNDSGELIRRYGVVQDITKKKLGERKLQESESKFREIAENLGVVICVRQNNQVVYINKAYEKVWGRSCQSLYDEPNSYLEALHPEDREVASKLLIQEFPLTQEYIETKYRIITPDGTVKNIWSKQYMICDINGEMLRTVRISEDVTSLKLAEEEYRRSESANSAKSLFLANMSHEIRTPINAIIGFNYLLQQTSLTSRQSDYVEKTLLSAKHLLGVINDILDISKIEANKIELESKEFDLYEVLYNVSNIVSISLYEKQLKLHYEIDPNIPQFYIGDALRFYQVLLNLINNAIKFTLEGEIKVSIVLDHLGENSASLRFSIEDTGIGIGNEEQKKLFHAFTQIDNTSTRKYGGTGLGLAISKSFIELMGGSIYVNSSLGKGSQFVFTVQFMLDKKQTADSNKRSPLTDLSLMLISDNIDMISMIATQLKPFGSKLVVTNCVSEALSRILISGTVDLIGIDWNLINEDCMNVAKGIKIELGDSSPPIIVVSSSRESILENIHDNNPIEGVFYFPMGNSQIQDRLCHMFSNRIKKADSTIESMVFCEKTEKVKILLVEDNALNQELTKTFLEELGFEADIAVNGRECLDMLESRSYDLILMDLLMPEMDGYEATKRIRANHTLKQIPIIAMSAHVMKGIKDQVIEAGMDDYISKPFHIPDMINTISTWVYRGKKLNSEENCYATDT